MVEEKLKIIQHGLLGDMTSLAGRLEDLTNKAFDPRRIDPDYIARLKQEDTARMYYSVVAWDSRDSFEQRNPDGLMGFAFSKTAHFSLPGSEFDYTLLDLMAIDPKYNNNGIGKSIFMTVLEQAQKKKNPLILKAQAGNGNNEFYNKMGDIAKNNGIQHDVVVTPGYNIHMYGHGKEQYAAVSKNPLALGKTAFKVKIF